MVAAAVMASALVATPANAGANCPSGYHCLFRTYVYDGYRYGFFNSDADFRNNYYGNGESVDNNSWAASNSSTGGYESHYYDGYNHTNFIFCVNPGGTVYDLGSYRDRASSLRLRPTTTVPCLA